MASPEVTIELQGLDQLESNLRALGTAVAKKLLKAAMKAGAEPVKKEMERRARKAKGGPTYPSEHTPKGRKSGGARGPGHLVDNIIVTARFSNSTGQLRIKIGPDKDHWYGAFQEFGTPNSPADPFMRPALDSKAVEALRIMEKDLWSGIERAVARMPK